MTDVAAKRAAFRQLHESGCFLLPNPWDVGGARLLQHLGYQAIASTSAGYAWSIGRPDNRVELPGLIDHLAALSEAVDIPMNADFENGFAHEPEKIADNVLRAAQAGVSGLSVEDFTGEPGKLYDADLAVERIAAAKAALAPTGVVLVARTEGLLHRVFEVPEAIERLVRFAEAGADCLYAPGLRRREDIEAVVRAVAPKPVNVLVGGPGFTLAELAEMGVRRVSTGGALAARAWGAFIDTARELKETEDFAAFSRPGPSINLNNLFAG